jgi:tRNA threonylcarbamoyladenosine biosynthesis protein TsaE
VAERLSLSELEERASDLWRALKPGAVVWLTGDLGTGKTTFVQMVCRAAGADRARSPTFALVHEYLSPDGPIFHVDCYRLRHPDEAVDLDFSGLLRDARLLVIEWPDRAGGLAPAPDAQLHFAHADADDVRLVDRVR